MLTGGYQSAGFHFSGATFAHVLIPSQICPWLSPEPRHRSCHYTTRLARVRPRWPCVHLHSAVKPCGRLQMRSVFTPFADCETARSQGCKVPSGLGGPRGQASDTALGSPHRCAPCPLCRSPVGHSAPQTRRAPSHRTPFAYLPSGAWCTAFMEQPSSRPCMSLEDFVTTWHDWKGKQDPAVCLSVRPDRRAHIPETQRTEAARRPTPSVSSGRLCTQALC